MIKLVLIESLRMVKIRLLRTGKKHEPHYRIVAMDSRVKRDGKYLEKIGYYNPRTKPPTVEYDPKILKKWMDVGAQMTDTVNDIFVREGVIKQSELRKARIKTIIKASKEAKDAAETKEDKEEAPAAPKEEAKEEAPKEEAEAPKDEPKEEEASEKPKEKQKAEVKDEKPAKEEKKDEKPKKEKSAEVKDKKEEPKADKEK